MTGQRLIALVQLPLSAAEDRRGHGLGIVPPHLAWHTSEEGQTLDHAFENGLGAFTRQGHGEGVIRMRPDEHEDGDLPSALGKIDIDVAEIRFEPLTWIAGERDEGFDVSALLFADIAAHGIITSL